MPIISLSYYSTLQISENGLSINAISCMRKYTYTQYVNYKNNEPIRSIVNPLFPGSIYLKLLY